MVYVMLFCPLKDVLYLYVITFQSMCALPNMGVFSSSLILCCPGMLLLCILNVVVVVDFVTLNHG